MEAKGPARAAIEDFTSQQVRETVLFSFIADLIRPCTEVYVGGFRT